MRTTIGFGHLAAAEVGSLVPLVVWAMVLALTLMVPAVIGAA
jgi:hypothetical protein